MARMTCEERPPYRQNSGINQSITIRVFVESSPKQNASPFLFIYDRWMIVYLLGETSMVNGSSNFQHKKNARREAF